VQTMNQLLSLIGQYGYLVIFFGVMVESIGVPLPGETILIAAGFLVHQGTLNPGETIMFAVLGTIVGNQIGYWAGRQGASVRLAVGPLPRAHLRTPRAGGGVVSLNKVEERCSWLAYTRDQGLRCPGSRYKPHALENLPLLQRPGGGVVGHGFDLDRVPI
jgi:hypothetical protein